jgi:hypothetical protein
MVTIRGHFDGKVIVPDAPVNLPTGRSLTFRVDLQETGVPPSGVPGNSLLRFAGRLTAQEADAIAEAIEQGCERVDGNEW